MAEQADHVFVYGKLRPDVVGTALPLPDACDAQKAWLLGGRLYSFNRGGQEHAAVRLREAGQATCGWVVKAPTPDVMSSLLRESEAREYSPQLYEKDIVEVCIMLVRTYVLYVCVPMNNTAVDLFVENGVWGWRRRLQRP